jgi:hypothetical protein
MTASIMYNKITNIPVEAGKTDYQWITASCFLSVSKWNRLLQEIEWFLIERKVEVEFFRIQFNYHNGENIRLLILTEKVNFDPLVQNLQQRFKMFFRSIPEDSLQLPIDSIFLPFPSSIIEFDLYRQNFEITHNILYEIEQEISYLLFDIFKDEEITETTLITVAFYMQMCIIKICNNDEKGFSNSSEVVEDKIKGAKREKYLKAFSDNRTILLEITRDIIGKETLSDEIMWVNKWMDICKRLFSLKIDQGYSESGIQENIVKENYNVGLLMINDFLGLNKEKQYFLNYLIASSLREYNINFK